MNQIERARLKAGVSRVAAHDLDVAQTPARDKFRCHRHVRRVGVKSDDPPVRRDPLGQQIDDAARSAAKIDRAVLGPQTNPVKEHSAIGCELVSLTLQAGTLAAAAAQRIDGVRVIDGCGGRSRFYRRLTGHSTQIRVRHHGHDNNLLHWESVLLVARSTAVMALRFADPPAPWPLHLARCMHAERSRGRGVSLARRPRGLSGSPKPWLLR